MTPQDIIDFWFSGAVRKKWFDKDPDFDADLRVRFLDLHEQAAAGGMAEWHDDPQGVLALLILLDQLPRNMFRDSPRAFATDKMALDIARDAVAAGFDAKLGTDGRRFLFLPFEHSEDLQDQRDAVALFEKWGDDPGSLDYANRHLAVIERFGRFPHRNAILGRTNTAEEEDYLSRPGAGF